ncbi:MAG: metallophosphoesterase [Solobacterium sp.]|nr:metallophosphoesterase [Solobacterium sp.]
MINIWAHRGCSYTFPENTLSSFAEALKYDITGIELDIQLTKDRQIVVIHDETVDRTTDCTGEVRNYTLAELQRLHIRGDENEHIPTIQEVFELVKPVCLSRGVLVNIELKNSVIRYEGMEEMILDLVAEYQLEPYVIYSSFNPDSLVRLKQLTPEIHAGVLAPEETKCLEIAEKIHADALHPFIKYLDVEDLRKKTTLPVRAWNVYQFEPFYPNEGELEIQNLEVLEKQGVTDIFTNAPEKYVPLYSADKSPEVFLIQDYDVDENSGRMIKQTGRMTSWLPVHVYAGDKIYLTENESPVTVYFYKTDIREELIYTYTYAEDGNWHVYDHCEDYDPAQESMTIVQEGYIRISFPYIGHQYLSEMIRLERNTQICTDWPDYFQEECRKTADTVNQLRRLGDLVYLLATDTHYASGSMWEDSFRNMKMLSRRIHPDGLIHLGDFTDGNMPEKVTREYVSAVMKDLYSLGIPVYCTIGNHDRNRFRGNPEGISAEAGASLYLRQTRSYYYQDFPEQKLRMFFLDSFDPDQKERYGYTLKEILWTALHLPWQKKDWRVVFFSHVPVLGSMHVWSKRIRGGDLLLRLLQTFNRKGNRIYGFVHGHNHSEQVNTQFSFPIISLGCNKPEYFEDHKPEGSHTEKRDMHTVTQDLFDVLIIHPEGTMDRIRFGAGTDGRIGQ